MDKLREDEFYFQEYRESWCNGEYKEFCLANERKFPDEKSIIELPRGARTTYGSYSPAGNDSKIEVFCVLRGLTTHIVKVVDQGVIHYELYCFHESIKESGNSRFQNLISGAEILIKIYVFMTFAEAIDKHMDYEDLYMGQYFKTEFDLKSYMKEDTKDPNFNRLKSFL